MKRLISLIFTVLLLFMLSSCSSDEVKKGQQDDTLLNSSAQPATGPCEPYDSCTVNISTEKLEMDFLEKGFVFQGDVMPKDDGVDFEKIEKSFAEQKENGNLFPASPRTLELRFSEAIPLSVTWYDIYMVNGNIAYPSISIPRPLDTVGVKTILPIGMNMAMALDSDSTPKEYYRIIRIVCEYDD
ncbi:MAG: hypothetical protein FWE80_08660, partial [Oscillospiraceae bacterium]|nr:hypothetical protein [Oscillospiraceae bacterium]